MCRRAQPQAGIPGTKVMEHGLIRLGQRREVGMFAKYLTAISIATMAALGAVALSVDAASAHPGGGGGGGGGGMHGGGGSHNSAFHMQGVSRQAHWDGRRHRYGWGYYGAPLLVGASTYAAECYYVRRYGALYKVCP
jgi:hypothetical protein